MNTPHTHGRVTFKEDGDANHWSMLTEDGRWLLSLLHNGESVSERQIANFRRLAACWNACNGIDTDDLEADSVSIIQKLHDDAAKRLMAQRDKLLEALRVVQSQCESMAGADWRKWEELASPEEFERWAKSRAAHMAVQAQATIAKQEGGA